MDCNKIPPGSLWSQASTETQRQYRLHLKSCRSCRRSLLYESPELMLHELSGSELPDEFWMGFWNSLYHKIVQGANQSLPWSFRIARWAVVFIFIIMLTSSGKKLDLPQTQNMEFPYPAEEYPIVEEIENPHITYYVLQGSKGQKVVLLFDAEMDL